MKSNGLPQTNCRIPMPETKEFYEKICENCDKADVCKYQERMYESCKRYFGYWEQN